MAYTRIVRIDTGVHRDDMIRRERDGAFIPADPLNADWQVYQAWLQAGNAPDEPAPAPTASSRT